MFAKVIVDIAHSNVDRIFTYSIDEGLTVLPGQRVMVPFGNGNKPVEGFVLSVDETHELSDSVKLKSVARTLEDYPAIDQKQIQCAFWIAKRYNCVLAEALRLMIPAQLRGERISVKTQRILELSSDQELIQSVESGFYTKTGKLRSASQSQLLELMKIHKRLSAKAIIEFIPSSEGAIKALVEKGALLQSREQQLRRPYQSLGEHSDVSPKLTKKQQDAVDNRIQSNNDVFLLYGVTGSGKTEVYMNSIMHFVQNGKSAIVLVPEISLTPQTVERFRRRFGDSVAVLHSRLSAGERFDEWRRTRLGEVKVVVGARSAVFAPLSDIGLIVIDEEHEHTYQSETNPRYNAIEVARQLCKLHGSSLVLGSATPSIESYLWAKRGDIKLLELDERVNEQPLPSLELVDMRLEIAMGNKGIFSAKMLDELKECINSGDQAILFLNRRGYNTFVSCRSCGYVIGCDVCDVSLTYHKFKNVGVCHFCSLEKPIPETCPVCGSKYLKYFGAGTQQVEESLKKLMPEVSMLRMDMDTTSTKDAHLEILSAFERQEAQVLIGTQMVVKGLDFPNVTFVGVLAADSSLHIPDYRSHERTFQLITQVAGRAGRDEKPGKVIVQTYSPNHPCIEFASRQDYKSFYNYELRLRRKGMFPPFTVFVRMLFSGDNEAELAKVAGAACSDVRSIILGMPRGEESLLMIQSSAAPIKKISNKFRYQVLAKLINHGQTRDMIDEIYIYAKANLQDHYPSIEVNPQNML